MPIIEGDNEFSGFPKDQVVDWLGHPVTEYVRSQLNQGVTMCNDIAVSICMNANRCQDANVVKSDAISISGTRVAYNQVLSLFEKAEAYVATKEETNG